MPVSEAKKQRRAEREERARRRAQERRRDRALAPVAVSGILGARVRDLAAAMRRHGVTGSVTVKDAKHWKSDPATAPDWLLEVFAECAAKRATREFRIQQEKEASEMREIRAEHTAAEKVKKNSPFRKFNDDEQVWLEDWMFRASKELVRGMKSSDVDEFTRRVLHLFGIDPNRHETWVVHAGDCDGKGKTSCAFRDE